MAGLPSVLAIRDLRRRIRRRTGGRLSNDVAVRLLALDPPAALRAIRAVAAPIYDNAPQQVTIPVLARTLGPSLLKRTLEVDTADVSGTGPVRKLWLHAIATAQASRMLASSIGGIDPDQAYVAGLLHDLPRWLELLGRRLHGEPPPGSAADWLRHWGVPGWLRDVLTHCFDLQHSGDNSPHPENPATLILAAEMLAELAEFPHPDDGSPETRELLLQQVDRNELIAAQRLRREVEAALQEVGLNLAVPEPEFGVDRVEFEDDIEPPVRRSDSSEIVLSMLACTKSGTYRGIVTATAAAALRYLHYDRSFYVKWIRRAGRVFVRSKADLSPRHIEMRTIEPTPRELQDLEVAWQTERPVRLAGVCNGPAGLLRWLGTDEAIAVPVNHDFENPSFLVLDRALSARPIQLLREADAASTLAITTSLLNENLLLKRRRQRAQKFALTDPLTRLFNRRMGIATLDQEIARAGRTDRPLTVLMIDLDEFKKLNDAHGHLQGDVALRATADELRRTLRRTDTICRYGGEEFLVVLPETTPEEASILAARLFVAVETRGSEIGLPVTVSIGLASVRPDDTVESLLQRADRALYASKSLGRNRFSVDAELE